MKIAYVQKDFRAATLATIDQANEIIEIYAAQGYDLTLRQLYYQFVSRALTPNTDKEYSRLGSVINDARLAGLVDWNAISDRTRNLLSLGHWDDPQAVIDSARDSYHLDYWAAQRVRLEVWIEKDALIGVIEGVCDRLDVPYFSCRGYTSQSEMWRAAMRLRSWQRKGQAVSILHLGDHDPSGIDMTRDIEDRLTLFGVDVTVNRLALNMDQVTQYNPPPNPAKMTDSRFASYTDAFGYECWELDALEPAVMETLIEDAVLALRDDDAWEATQAQEATERAQLAAVARQWDTVVEMLGSDG